MESNSFHDQLNTISEWLARLQEIPKKQMHKETLLDIAGIEHLENHWSYIYMYFFNPNASHGLSRLFIDALQEIICKKTHRQTLTMALFSVLREEPVPDEKGNMKRIDLLLRNDHEAIIIENKVYAKLNNRLDVYWRKPDVPDENKRGVVLSLWRTKPTHHGFVNITHEEFAKTIEKKLPSYSMSAQPKGLMLLQDFIQNIYNITHSMNEEEFYFYFNEENRQKINRLAEIRKNVIRHIWQPIENKKLLEPLFRDAGFHLSVRTKAKESDNYVYYAFDAMPDDVMLTLCYDTLWDYDRHGCRIGMFLELQGDMMRFAEEHAGELKEMGIAPDGHKKEMSWWHFRGTDIRYTPQELIKPTVIVGKIVEGIRHSNFYEMGMNIIRQYERTKPQDDKNQETTC